MGPSAVELRPLGSPCRNEWMVAMSEQITLTATDGHRLSAYRAGAEDAPAALVVVQEIFGVNHHMRHVCDTFAEQGYLAIAPACSIASNAAWNSATTRPESSAARCCAASSTMPP